MPEGHTIHRLARDQQRIFGGAPVAASSPQGRFAEGAALIDGLRLARTEAYGKHLLHHYVPADRPRQRRATALLHVHLGLYGKFTTGRGEPPAPRGALRLRLVGGADEPRWTDLRGPTACELIEADERADLLARLGPDPLRPDADPTQGFGRLSRSRTSVAALLMDQRVVAGIGNVYRAELLFRHRVDPYLPGRALPESTWVAMWADLVVLMNAGVRAGRIVTVRAEDKPRKRGRLTREESVYVYRRTGQPCRLCGTEIRTAELVGRNLFWCPSCQAPGQLSGA